MVASFTTAATAEPISVQVMGAVGFGVAQHQGVQGGPLGGIAAVDMGWRGRPGHAWVLSIEGGATGFTGATSGEHRRVDIRYGAILMGLERTQQGHGIRGFVQAGVGLGRMWPDVHPGIFDTGSFDERKVTGLALNGCAGLRLIPGAGPVGLVLATRTSHVVAARTSGHVLTLITFGLTFHPQ